MRFAGEIPDCCPDWRTQQLANNGLVARKSRVILSKTVSYRRLTISNAKYQKIETIADKVRLIMEALAAVRRLQHRGIY